MAELIDRKTTETDVSCCSAEAQATCCEPADKTACCGESATGGSCGCIAGQSAPQPGEIREAYAPATPPPRPRSPRVAPAATQTPC